MPTFLTTHEIEAIRKGSVFIGMSRKALYMSMGFPKKNNDSLRGTDQLVYSGGTYVYVLDDKVVEVQSH